MQKYIKSLNTMHELVLKAMNFFSRLSYSYHRIHELTLRAINRIAILLFSRLLIIELIIYVYLTLQLQSCTITNYNLVSLHSYITYLSFYQVIFYISSHGRTAFGIGNTLILYVCFFVIMKYFPNCIG